MSVEEYMNRGCCEETMGKPSGLSQVPAQCDCSASLQTVKQLVDAMHHHIQEANRYALELRKYAMPKLEREIQTPNGKDDTPK